ncbi:MAG: PorT family protein [Crocinitomicaceae bacterium]|nr:PorT family protein [Crocinitomicaceae bacterium]
MKNSLSLIVASLFYFNPFGVNAQRIVGLHNLERFDTYQYHFGFLLSANTSSFFIDYKPDFTFRDSLLGIDNVPQVGFNLALLASYNPVKNVNVRFVPGLSFQDRGLNYRFLNADGSTETFLKKTESVWLEFPLLAKLRTNRVGNFAAYALIGGKYAMDMQTQKDVNNTIAEQIVVKLKDRDYCIEAGGGLDFFLPYFKFAVEFKSSIGLPNLLVPEPNKFADPIQSLRTRTFVLSFTFEG